ncbi:hypothetical protein [Caballeronia sordidicola]|uniref:hypothetical protein n=1 Tax=Caballeronia sordidicola TaxID=196367 RepID=UPI000A3A8F53|nr:hypothetical protein [Caballeronia sordidicola]
MIGVVLVASSLSLALVSTIAWAQPADSPSASTPKQTRKAQKMAVRKANRVKKNAELKDPNGDQLNFAR